MKWRWILVLLALTSQCWADEIMKPTSRIITAADLKELEGLIGTGSIATCYTAWRPEQDITVYELALCVPVLTGWRFATDYHACGEVGCLPPNARRHFKEECQ
jgi:hypothetical protein